MVIWMRIYLVDDESMALDYLARLVDWGRMGHDLIGMSTDATVALEACLHERVDLLVSDIRMPKIDGIGEMTGGARLWIIWKRNSPM